MSDFVHLHNHTMFSALDGTQKMKQMFDAVLEDGQVAAAITDHGTLAGTWRFHKEAKSAGVKPILGIEAYLSIGDRRERNFLEVPAEDDFDGSSSTESSGATKVKRYEHLTMLASTPEGWTNLVRMVNRAENQYWYKPRMDFDMMAEIGTKGIIVGTGCLGGPVAGALLRDDFEAADAAVRKLIDLFGRDHVFAEVMDHGIPAERKVIGGIVQLAKKYGLKVVATNDCHYTHEHQADAHDAWLCVSQKKGSKTVMVSDTDRFKFNGSGYHLRTAAEMHAIFDNQPGTEDAVSNSVLIADMCDMDVIGETKTRLPKFPLPKEDSSWSVGNNIVTVPAKDNAADLLYDLVRKGAVKRYGPLSQRPDVKARLRREMDVILHFGYEDYFLIEYDAIDWARSDRGYPTPEYPRGKPGEKRPILVGPGRGSAAGSCVAYCLWITNIEPLENDLLFERFLDPSRYDFPDIDSDFEASRRDEVITYLEHRWGHNTVARLGTFSVAWAKRAIKDTARVTGRTPLANQLTPMIHIKGKPEETPLEKILSPEYFLGADLQQRVAADQESAELIEMAKSVEGVIAGESIHACGIVLGDEPLDHLIPLRYDRRKGRPGDEWVTSWDAHDASDFGLVKFDFLFINDYDVVAACLKNIERTTGEHIDVDNLPMGKGKYNGTPQTDPEIVKRDNERAALAWYRLGQGRTAGVFQLGGGGITELTRSVRPETLDDIAAICALYRPGPMASGEHEKFARRRRGGEKASYDQWTRDPVEGEVIESVLSKTLMCITYQEQLMLLARKIADFNDAEVNRLRKAFSKKIRSEMDALYDRFIEGGQTAVRSDGSPKVAFRKETLTSLWKTFAGSAEYLFNSSHAYAYGYMSYITAFLKANWPNHYGAALLSCVDKGDKRVAMMESLRNDGVVILPPSVNHGGFITGVDDEGNVRLGMSEVVGGGDNTRWIVHEREQNGPFKSMYDLLNRVRLPQSAENQLLTKKLPVSTVEALIEAGALDEFSEMEHGAVYRKGMRAVVRAAADNPEVSIPKLEWGVEEKSIRERFRLGMLIGESPLKVLADQIKDWREPAARNGKPIPLHKIPFVSGETVSTIGTVSAFTQKTISSGTMFSFTLEGSKGSIECVMWPTQASKMLARGMVPVVGAVLGVTGRTRLYSPPRRDDDEITVDEEGNEVQAEEPDEVLSLVASDLWVGELDDEGVYDIPQVETPIRGVVISTPDVVIDVQVAEDEVTVMVDPVAEAGYDTFDDVEPPADSEPEVETAVIRYGLKGPGAVRVRPNKRMTEFPKIMVEFPAFKDKALFNELEDWMNSDVEIGDEFTPITSRDGKTTLVFYRSETTDKIGKGRLVARFDW